MLLTSRFGLFLVILLTFLLFHLSCLHPAYADLDLQFEDKGDISVVSDREDCQLFGIQNGDLLIIPDNYDKCSITLSNLDIDPLKSTIFQVGFRCDDLTRRGVRIFWTKKIGDSFQYDRSIYKEFDLKYLKGAEPYQTVTFDLAQNLEWSGTIKEMKFEFNNLSQIVYIDFLSFRNAPLLSSCAPLKKWFGLNKRVFLIFLPFAFLVFLGLIRLLQVFKIFFDEKSGEILSSRLRYLFAVLCGFVFMINANFPFDFFPYLRMNIKNYGIIYPIIMVLFVLILHIIVSPKSLNNFDKTKVFYFLFMICGIISLKNSISIHDSMIRVVLYFLPTALILIAVNPKFFNFKHVRLVCAFIVFSCMTVSINGLIEVYFNRNLFFDDLYRAYAPIYIEYILGLPASSSFVDPSVLGSFLVLCLPFCLHFMIFERDNRFFLILGILSSLTTLICLIFTCSWGSLLAFIISIFFYLFQNQLRLFLIISTGLVVIGIVTFFVILPGYLKYVNKANEIDKIITEENLSMHEIAERFSKDLDQTFYYSMNQRIEGGKMAFLMASKKPFFGIGLGNYDNYFTKHYGGKQLSLWIYTVPDNQFLRSLAENGFFGFIFFTAAFIALFVKLIKSILKKSVDKKINKLSIAFTASILGFTVNITAYDGLFWFSPNFCFWFVVALFLSLYSFIEKEPIS